MNYIYQDLTQGESPQRTFWRDNDVIEKWGSVCRQELKDSPVCGSDLTFPSLTFDPHLTFYSISGPFVLERQPSSFIQPFYKIFLNHLFIYAFIIYYLFIFLIQKIVVMLVLRINYIPQSLICTWSSIKKNIRIISDLEKMWTGMDDSTSQILPTLNKKYFYQNTSRYRRDMTENERFHNSWFVASGSMEISWELFLS